MNGPEDESQEDELEDDLEADDNAALLDEEEARLRYIIWIQLNEYETAPYFIQFSRNLTSDCLLISVLYPEFTWAEPWNYFEHQNKTISNFRFSSGKFGGKNRNQQTITCQVLAELNKIWSCLIFIRLYKVNV